MLICVALPDRYRLLNRSAFPDGQGTFVDENNWIRAWSNDLYLWYSEIEDVDPESYSGSTSAVLEYFDLMKSFETTASGEQRSLPLHL